MARKRSTNSGRTARRDRSRTRGGKRPSLNDPLDPDELIRLELRRPAAAERPLDERPARRLLVSPLKPGGAAPVVRAARGIKGAFTIEADGPLAFGALGRSSGHLKSKDLPGGFQASTRPHRPSDVAYNYLPRLAPRKTVQPLRSIRGTLIAPEKVYGNDDRQTFFPTGYPWHCTGRVFSWTNPASGLITFMGSGVLVGRRHVLTAGHVCPVAADPWMMLFVPASFDDSSVVVVDSYVSDYRGFFPGNPSGTDMAVLRLYDPLGDRLGWFGSKCWEDRWLNLPAFTHVGWPLALGGKRPAVQPWFPVLRVDVEKDAMELLHHGDTSDGDSGGPLFGFWQDGFPYVIGTHSGADLTDNKDFNAAAGGPALIGLIRWALANWP